MDARRIAEKLVAVPMSTVLAFGMLPVTAMGTFAAALPQQASAAASSGTWHGVSYDIDDAGNVTFHAGEMTGGFQSDEPFESATGLKDAVSVRADGTVTLPENSDSLFYGCAKLESVDMTNFDSSQVTSMASLFAGCSKLASLSISSLDTSRVTRVSNMFYGCASLSGISLSGLDTSQVTSMSGFFSGCSALSSIDLTGLSTTSVTDMAWMFSGCSSLASLSVSGLDTSQVTTMREMFSGCTAMTRLDLTGFDTSQTEYLNSMFSGCSSLESLNLSSFDTSSATDMADVFDGCEKLQSVTLGAEFSFEGAGSMRQCSLPAGTWLSSADGKRYRADAVPNNVAAEYSLVADEQVTELIEGKAKTVRTEVSGTTVELKFKAVPGKKAVNDGKKEIRASLQKVRFVNKQRLLSTRFRIAKKAKKKKKGTFKIPSSEDWHGWKVVFVEIGRKALWKFKKGYASVSIPSRVERIYKFAFGKSSFKKLVLKTSRLTKAKRVKFCLGMSKIRTVKALKRNFKKTKKAFKAKTVLYKTDKSRKVKVVR